MGLSLGDDEDTQLHILLSKPELIYSDKSPTDFAIGHYCHVASVIHLVKCWLKSQQNIVYLMQLLTVYIPP